MSGPSTGARPAGARSAPRATRAGRCGGLSTRAPRRMAPRWHATPVLSIFVWACIAACALGPQGARGEGRGRRGEDRGEEARPRRVTPSPLPGAHSLPGAADEQPLLGATAGVLHPWRRLLRLLRSTPKTKKTPKTPRGKTAVERNALLAFKAAADPQGKALRSWNARTRPNYCSWAGVFCGVTGRVTSLTLVRKQLTGTVSVSLKNLSRLHTLDLSSNALHGAFPAPLAALTSLSVLQLQYNKLSGRIPPTLWRPTLDTFYANDNSFSGRLSLLARAKGLRNLRLSRNRIVGALPSGVRSMTALRSLQLAFNGLSGALPPALGALSHLRTLDLTHNAFTGAIPAALGRCTLLTELLLGFNQLRGPVPSELGKLRALVSLNATHNTLSGPLPPAWGSLPRLRTLDLSSNSLEGPLPEALRGLSALVNASLQSNRITGPLPQGLSGLTALRGLYLAHNPLNIPFPTFLGSLPRLVALSLQGCVLSGSIPSMDGAEQLTALDLSVNGLTGSIPETVTRLRSLAGLDVRNNSLTGGLPPQLSAMTALRSVLVAHNPGLGGELPAWTSSFKSLAALNVTNCKMGGPIPSTLFNIATLTRFDFSMNFFNGTVPTNGLNRVNNVSTVFRFNCLLYSNQTPYDCPYWPRNGMCYLGGQRPLGECLPPTPPSPSGVNSSLGTGILVFVSLLWLLLFAASMGFAATQSSLWDPLDPACWGLGGAERDSWDKMYLEGSDGALLAADTELPGMPHDIRRFTMDEVWTATANFSAYLDPDDLRPAFHGRLSRSSQVTVRLLPLSEEQLDASKEEFVDRINALSRLSCSSLLSFQGYAYEDGCFVAVFEPVQQTLFERLHSPGKADAGRALGWRERMRIVLSVADALDFLHTAKASDEAAGGGGGGGGKRYAPSMTFRDKLARGLRGEEFNPGGPFVHGDVKSSNVLLTHGNRAKLFDALIPRNPEENPLRSVSAHGSFGYLDPNYADTKALSAASDVYSFGVLLLEVISGRPAMEEDSATLIVMAQDYFILRDDYPKLLDPALRLDQGGGEPGGGGVPRHELVAMMELVQTCTQVKEESRPSMEWVKEQMMVGLRMGPEEYMGGGGGGGGLGGSEIEIEMMSEGSPNRYDGPSLGR